MKTIKILFTAFAALATLCATAQSTQKFTAAKHNEYGLTYSLPTTHLCVQIKAEHVVRQAGPYYKYAKKYLGTTDVVTTDSEEWNLTDVQVSSFGVPSDDRYLMQFKSGSAPFVLTTADGVLLAMNTEKVEVPEKVQFGRMIEEATASKTAASKSLPGELLVSESTAKRAEIAAQMIYQIRESRTNYATGEVDHMPDGNALKIIMQQLDEQEAALTALFVGSITRGSAVRNYDVEVDTVDFKSQVIARISDFNGIVEQSDLSGEPVSLSMTITDGPELPVNDKGEVKKLPKNALIYTIPGKARFTVSYKGKDLVTETLGVAQLGTTFGLDPNLIGDKKAPSYVKFDPSTGAVTEIGPAAPMQ